MKCIIEGHIRRDKLDGCGKEYTLLQVLHSVFRAADGAAR